MTELVTVKIIFDKNSISVRISSSWMCGADCWLVSESETENILASDSSSSSSSSESPRPPFVAGKHSSRLWLGSKYSTPYGLFARTELLTFAGVDFLVLVGRQRDQGETRSSSEVVRDFCYLPVRTHRCRTVSSSARCKLVSYRFLALLRRQCCLFF